MARRPFTITQVRCEAGVWRARVTVDGKGVDVDRKYGSWMIPIEDGRTIECLPEIAAALADVVRPLESKVLDKKKAKAKAQTQAKAKSNGKTPAEIAQEIVNPFLEGVSLPAPLVTEVSNPEETLAEKAARLGVQIG